MTVEELKIQISANTKDIQKSLETVKSELQNLANQAKSTSGKIGNAATSSAKSINNSFNKVSNTAETLKSDIDEIRTRIEALRKVKAFNGVQLFSDNFDRMSAGIALTEERANQLQSKINQVNMELAKMILSGQGGSPAFQQKIEELQNLQSQLGNTQTEVQEYKNILDFAEQNKSINATGNEIKNVGYNASLSAIAMQQLLDKFELQSATMRVRELGASITICKQAIAGFSEGKEGELFDYQNIDQAKSSLEDLQMELDAAKVRVNNLKNKAAETSNTKINLQMNSDSVQTATTAWDKFKATVLAGADSIQKRFSLLTSGFAELKRGLDGAGDTTLNTDGTTSSAINLKKVLSDAFDSMSEKMKPVVNGLSKVGAAFSAVAKIAKGALGSMVSFTSNLAKKMNILAPIAKRVGNAFKSLGAKIANVFIYSTIMNFFNKLKSAVSDYIATNSELQAALGSCKAAWLTAFQPIYDVVVPMLSTLIGWLTKAGQALAAFFAMLGGKSVKTYKANAEGLYNQAKATSAAGGAAEEAQKQIMGFDEINKLDSNKSGGGGGGGSAMDMTAFSDIDDSKITNIGDAFGNLLDRLIAKLPAFNDLLQRAADKLNHFSDILLQVFSPTNTQKVTVLTSGIADAFNGLVNRIDFSKLGSAVSSGLNFVIQAFNSFMERMNWTQLGNQIAQGFNGLFSKIKLSDIVKSLQNIHAMVWETLKGLVQGIKWYELGAWIAEGIQGINWNTMITNVTTTIKSLIAGLGDTIGGFLLNVNWGKVVYDVITLISDLIMGAGQILYQVVISLGKILVAAAVSAIANIPNTITGALASVTQFLANVFNSLGLDTIGEFFQGITDALLNVTDWLHEHIAVPICNGVKNMFKSNKDVNGAGGDIGQGLLDGIKEKFSNIGTWIKTNIFTPVVDKIKGFFGIASPSTVMKEIGGYLSEGLKEGVTEKWASVVSTVQSKLEDLKGKVQQKWESIKSSAQSAWTSVKNTIKGFFNSSDVSTTTSTQSISLDTSSLSSASAEITNQMNKMESTVKTSTNNMKSTFSSCFNDVKNSISNTFTSIANSISSKMTQIKSNVTATANSLRGIFNFNAGRISVTVPNMSVSWSLSKLGSSYTWVPNVYAYSYSTYATGGFPEDGMFFANSNELVGEFSNGKNAVANNAQIVEGIKQGVEIGVINALREASKGNSSDDKLEVNVYLDEARMASRLYPYFKSQSNIHGKSLINA